MRDIPVSGKALEEVIGYRFNDRRLVKRALTHRSWKAEQTSAALGDNEQLEFLGDSVLGFVVSEALFQAHPSAREGQLSLMKAQLVCSVHLYGCALRLGLGEFLHLGRGEERNGGRNRRTLLANTMEAIIAAIFLDGGLAPSKAFIERHVLAGLQASAGENDFSLIDYKGALQERAQARALPTPRYVVISTAGPEHAKLFIVEARIGAQFASRGQGSSKKVASREAAQNLLAELDSSGWKLPTEESAYVSAGE